MKIVLGLGNPGARYRGTRHNLGFRVVDRLAARVDVEFRIAEELGGKAWSAIAVVGGREIVLAKPRTYMNRSGRAAVALCDRYGVGPGQLLVVHDDADLELGRVRLRPRGRPGGHRGVASLIDAMRTEEFPRLKLGVRGEGREGRELADYVLDEFAPAEEPVADRLVELGVEVVVATLQTDMEDAMNRFNSRSVVERDEADEARPGGERAR